MSRIDRFLFSESWNNEWPTCKQWCLDKGLSDHFPIMHCEYRKNWGPKPFRILSCRKDTEGYHNFTMPKKALDNAFFGLRSAVYSRAVKSIDSA
jgi:hypothetical protein